MSDITSKITMNFGEFTPWEPLKLERGTYFIADFFHSFKGLVIYLYKEDSERSTKMVVTFHGTDVMTRIVNESYSSGQWGYLREHLKGKNATGPLYTVENSEYTHMLSYLSDRYDRCRGI